MPWLYHRNYFGPDRRSDRFAVRFLDRRKRGEGETSRISVRAALRELFERGLKWVDVATYFGPDRRSGVFSHFILERRRLQAAGSPPPLHAALRQLRVRVLDVDDPQAREALKERIIATALLADAQGRTTIGDHLTRVAERFEGSGDDLAAVLQSELLAAEAMLHDSAEPHAPA